MTRDIKDKIIYHGSYIEIKQPDLSKCSIGKDFGKGFYTTTDRAQAIKFAKRVAKIHKLPYEILNLYKLSNFDNLNIYKFSTTNKQWLNCIVGFRNARFRTLALPYKDFDVIIGKIADDDTSLVINAYIAGVYGQIGSEKAVNIAISNLIPERLRNQITFRSKQSLGRIRFIRGEQVWL